MSITLSAARFAELLFHVFIESSGDHDDFGDIGKLFAEFLRIIY